MVRTSTAEKHFRYLSFTGTSGGSHFIDWLTELGLKELPYGLKIENIIERGWLKPVLRVDLPSSYFSAWRNYPELPKAGEPLAEEDRWSEYCEVEWAFPSGNFYPEWFLHPYDRSSGEGNEFRKHAVDPDATLPELIRLGERPKVRSVYWYFSHWQGYQLIDLLNVVVLFPTVSNLPNALNVLNNFCNNYSSYKTISDLNIKQVLNRWGKREKVFSWLSYYRTMLGTASCLAFHDAKRRSQLITEGAQEIASHLQIGGNDLEKAFEKHFLKIFQEWQWSIQRESLFHKKALDELRKDIYYALDWLCRLSGKPAKFYLDKWKYPDRSEREWAQLRDVLPFEDLKVQDHFLRLAPRYIKEFNEQLPERLQIGEQKFKSFVDGLWRDYKTFPLFCRAFYKLHQQMVRDKVIDLKNYDILDYFLTLAMRTEALLSEIYLGRKLVPGQDEGANLVKIFKRYQSAIGHPCNDFQNGLHLALNRNDGFLKLTELYDFPEEPLKKISKALEVKNQNPIAQKVAFHVLVCNLARNYFAHHTYLDDYILENENARTMIVSILVTALYLSAAKLGVLHV
jgi:hypothetical protein